MARKRDRTLVPFHEREYDLCEQLEGSYRVKCPVKSGVETRQRGISLDIDVSRSEHVVLVDAWTRDQERITCLQGILEL